MHSALTIDQVDEMIELARQYCSRLAAYRAACEHGTVSASESCAEIERLARIDATIERLKHGEPKVSSNRPGGPRRSNLKESCDDSRRP
jgi:hypothetical protein